MAKRYIQKLVTVEAVQFDGKNHDEVVAFCKDCICDGEKLRFPYMEMEGGPPAWMNSEDFKRMTTIDIVPGSWIAKGADGYFYPCGTNFLDSHEPIPNE